MAEEFSELSPEESLRAENDFLKMKMMLENGARFESVSDTINPVLENFFLNQVLEFENQVLHASLIKIYDKIGRPTQFKPVAELKEEEVQEKLDELLDFLEKHFISLEVYSTNISAREIYRFATEELFMEEMEDCQMDGMTTCFAYDDYHPDPIYENTNIALEFGMKAILSCRPLTELWRFRTEKLQLNDHYDLSIEEFRQRVNLFKLGYDTIEEPEFKDVQCYTEGDLAFVKGLCNFTAECGNEAIDFSGKWLVNLEKDEQSDWSMYSIQIEGINF